MTLPADVHASGAVREALRAVLGRGGIRDDRADEVLLVVTEAVTNACRHAYPAGEGDVALTVELDGDLMVTVTDRGAGFDSGPSMDPGAGYGMTLMRALSDCEHSTTPGGGTTVRMRFTVSG